LITFGCVKYIYLATGGSATQILEVMANNYILIAKLPHDHSQVVSPVYLKG